MSDLIPAAILETTPSPAVIVLMDRVRHNVAKVLDLLDGDTDRWRPHLKTTKIPEVWTHLLDVGIRNFKCATVREASVFLETADEYGADVDLLVAFPHVGPNLDDVARLATMYDRQRVSILVETPDAAADLPEPLGAFVDVNSGMDRTGAPFAERDRIRAAARALGDRLRGIHAYDGHLAGTLDERIRAGAAIYDTLVELVEHLREEGCTIDEVITTGTPGLVPAIRSGVTQRLAPAVHRVSPGTVVFHDARTAERVEELDLKPAALILARVVAHPTPDIVTCDAGSKTITTDAGLPSAVVVDHPELTGLTPSEEHLPFAVAEGHTAPPRGATLLLEPRHVCPCVNLAERAILVDNASWQEVDVAARAH